MTGLDSSIIDVTIVIVPREKFSCTKLNLNSLLENTGMPYELIYVDGNSPEDTRQWLHKKLAKRPHTRLLRYNYYLGPAQSRILALPEVRTRYVAVVDNDVYLRPGWLEALYRCAVEEEADVVTPLTTIGGPQSEVIHVAGGEERLGLAGNGRPAYRHWQRWENLTISQVESELKREKTGLTEEHCALFRTAALRAMGQRNHNTSMMTHVPEINGLIQSAGLTVYFEPAARVVYLWGDGIKLALSDLPYWSLVWSEQWNRREIKKMYRWFGLKPSRQTRKNANWWMGQHRRLPLIPFMTANQRFFQRLKLAPAGLVINKSLEYLETGFNYLLVFGLSRTKAANRLPLRPAVSYPDIPIRLPLRTGPAERSETPV